MSRQEEGPESCGTPAQNSETGGSRRSPEYCHIDSEIIGQSWSNAEHVALHPRFSGQHDELDE